MYEPCYSRNALHPNEESRREEARNWCCLVNRQFLGGYEMLVPIYCPPPTPSSEICLGGRRRRRKGRAFRRAKGPSATTPCKHPGKRERDFFPAISLCAGISSQQKGQKYHPSSLLLFLSPGEGEGKRGGERRSLASRLLATALSCTQKPAALKELPKSSPSPVHDPSSRNMPSMPGGEHFLRALPSHLYLVRRVLLLPCKPRPRECDLGVCHLNHRPPEVGSF